MLVKSERRELKNMSFNSSDIQSFKNVWVFCEQRQGEMMPTTFELISERSEEHTSELQSR